MIRIEPPNDTREYWRADLPGPGHPVLFTRTLVQMESILKGHGLEYEICARGKAMLVLSRKAGEAIVLTIDKRDGEVSRQINVEVLVTKIYGTRVWLGIEAPDEVHIRRNELPAEREGTDDSSS